VRITGNKIFLRYPNVSDVNLIYRWDKDQQVSRKEIREFILNNDIYLSKHLRFMICTIDTKQQVGCIDLFDFDEYHRRAEVGILIADKKHRNNGYASESLQLLIHYSFTKLHLHQLYSHVAEDNIPSLRLFLKNRFRISGQKKDWLRNGQGFKDLIILQLINTY
jgi:diamine N-acetyltransferase